MGEIVAFPGGEPEELYLDEMNEEQLQACLEDLRQRIRELDSREPKNMNSDAYERWAEEHEELEDLMDEILDLLDTL